MRICWLISSFVLIAAAGQAQPRAETAAGVPLRVGETVAGELTPNDVRRPSGKYEDAYRLEGRRGDRVELRLGSEAFDAYLLVTGPDGRILLQDHGNEVSFRSIKVREFARARRRPPQPIIPSSRSSWTVTRRSSGSRPFAALARMLTWSWMQTRDGRWNCSGKSSRRASNSMCE